MPALVAGIHVLLGEDPEDEHVDGRDKPGHDEEDCEAIQLETAP